MGDAPVELIAQIADMLKPWNCVHSSITGTAITDFSLDGDLPQGLSFRTLISHAQVRVNPPNLHHHEVLSVEKESCSHITELAEAQQ